MSAYTIACLILGAAAGITFNTALIAARQRRALKRNPPRDPVAAAVEMNHTYLGVEEVRDRLSRMLKNLGITGDANIRGGVVVETVAGADLGPKVLALRTKISALLARKAYASIIGRDLYVARKPKIALPGQPEVEYVLADLELDDLASLVVALERVVEDRKRSRSLYKGLTADEVKAMAESALIRLYPIHADEIKRGDWNTSAPLRHAVAALDQFLLVKGANA